MEREKTLERSEVDGWCTDYKEDQREEDYLFIIIRKLDSQDENLIDV